MIYLINLNEIASSFLLEMTQLIPVIARRGTSRSNLLALKFK
jgi:hypothetical protein